MTELLIRLTLLLLTAMVANLVFVRAEPSWRLAIFRATSVAVVLLIAIALFQPAWNLAVLQPERASVVAVAEPVPAESQNVPVTVSVPVESASPAPVASSVSLSVVLLAGWALVAFLLLFRQLITHVKFSMETRNFDSAPVKIQQLWQQICSECKVEPTTVLIASGKGSPHLSFNGNLVLPSDLTNDDISSDSLSHVLRHEAAHLAAKDHRWLPATAVLTRLIWFHPLAWWLNASHLRACEDARDAQAARVGGAERYRSTLARLALDWIPVRGATASMFRRKSDLLRRLNAVSRTVEQKPVNSVSRISVGLMGLAFALVFGGVALVPKVASAAEAGFFGSWKTTDPKTRYAKAIDVIRTDDSVVLKLWYSNGGSINPSPMLVEFPLSEVKSTGRYQRVEGDKDFGFKTANYVLKSTAKGVTLSTKYKYKDDSGRKDREDDWTFVRMTRQPVVTQTADRKGWEGFWRNEDRGGQGALQLEINSSNEMLVWGRQGGGISREPYARLSLDINGDSATGKVDQGFCVRSYTLKKQVNGKAILKVETDYTDPKRNDREFLWVFEPGQY